MGAVGRGSAKSGSVNEIRGAGLDQDELLINYQGRHHNKDTSKQG